MTEQATRRLSTPSDYADAVTDLFGRAQRKVAIFTPHLDPAVFDRPALVEAVKAFALGNRLAQLRILIRTPEPVVRDGRRLLDLARRLSSKIHLRALATDFQDREDAFAIADETLVVMRVQDSTWEGVYDESRRELAQRLCLEFEGMWEHSTPDPGFRRLHI